MKGLKLEIPILAIILLVASLFGVNYFKNQKIDDLQDEIEIATYNFDSVTYVAKKLTLEIHDTIEFYETLITDKNKEISYRKQQADNLDQRLSEIEDDVGQYDYDTIYKITKTYLPWETDSAEYIYSGNQVEEMYFEHLQLQEMVTGVINLRKYSNKLEQGLELRNRQLQSFEKLDSISTAQLQEQEEINTLLNNQNNKLEDRSKKRGAVATVSVVLNALLISIILL